MSRTYVDEAGVQWPNEAESDIFPPCPWCKAVPGPHPSEILADEYMIIRHKPDCYLALDGVLTAMDQEAITRWCAL